MIVVAGTGHRESRCRSEEHVRERSRESLQSLGPDIAIVGMANGFDLWYGHEAHLQGIEIWCARPWAGHEARVADRELYELLVSVAGKVVDVNSAKDYPGPFVYHKRNQWMVDNADYLLAYWDGHARGGTFACRNYAKLKGVPVRNIW